MLLVPKWGWTQSSCCQQVQPWSGRVRTYRLCVCTGTAVSTAVYTDTAGYLCTHHHPRSLKRLAYTGVPT